jgi:hypothetical protein
VVTDLGTAQLQHPAQHFQLCLAHQVRDLQYCIDAHRCTWAYRLQSLLYRAMRLGKHRNTSPEDLFARGVVLGALMAFLSVTLRTSQHVAGLGIRLFASGLTLFLFRLKYGGLAIAGRNASYPAALLKPYDREG